MSSKKGCKNGSLLYFALLRGVYTVKKSTQSCSSWVYVTYGIVNVVDTSDLLQFETRCGLRACLKPVSAPHRAVQKATTHY